MSENTEKQYCWTFLGWAGPAAEADPVRSASLKQSWAATDLTDMVGLIVPNSKKHLASRCDLMILQNAILSNSAIL